MSAQAVEVAWFDEPIDVTPERQKRLEDWVVSYATSVRDMWAANGEDVTTDEARTALQLVAYSMFVPERDTWMPLGQAMYVQMGTLLSGPPADPDPNSEAALEFRDALRTIKTATDAEMDWAISKHLDISIDSARAQRLRQSGFRERNLDGRTALYRHYDADGALLYVGIALDPERRAEQHRRNSGWHKLSQSMTTEWFDTRDAAHEAERRAIRDERPIFNTTHAGREAKDRAIEFLLSRAT